MTARSTTSKEFSGLEEPRITQLFGSLLAPRGFQLNQLQSLSILSQKTPTDGGNSYGLARSMKGLNSLCRNSLIKACPSLLGLRSARWSLSLLLAHMVVMLMNLLSIFSSFAMWPRLYMVCLLVGYSVGGPCFFQCYGFFKMFDGTKEFTPSASGRRKEILSL